MQCATIAEPTVAPNFGTTIDELGQPGNRRDAPTHEHCSIATRLSRPSRSGIATGWMVEDELSTPSVVVYAPGSGAYSSFQVSRSTNRMSLAMAAAVAASLPSLTLR